MASREKILLQQVTGALLEDVGAGDVTSLAIIEESATGVAEIYAKSGGIVCGLPLCELTFLKVDPDIEFKMLIEEGQPFSPNDRVALVSGRLRSILTAERTALNFLMRLSGIASLTNRMVKAAAEAGDNNLKILDTRKTTPGLRYIEKYAVATGGGENHRYGLYDMVLIKDNHIEAAGSISSAFERVDAFLKSEKFCKIFHTDPSALEIEIEVEDQKQLTEALECGIKRIMLDNKSPKHLTEMVEMVRAHPSGADVKLEASGNVTLDNISEIASTGIDFISIGALTHSAPACDFSLDLLSDE